jgi:hypothetical protein
MAGNEGREDTSATSATSAATARTSTEPGYRRAQERHELRSSTASAEQAEVERHKLQFGLREQIAYHAIREQALARLSRFLTGLQVFLGTSAIASISDLIPIDAVWYVIVSALSGVILLVLDPSGGARDHRALRVRYHHVLADYEESECSATDLRTLKGRLQRIFADAPPAYRVVQAIAFNTAVNSTDPEETAAKYRYFIGAWPRLAANWIPMRGFKFRLEE